MINCPRPTIECSYRYPGVNECTTDYCQKNFDEIIFLLQKINYKFDHINKSTNEETPMPKEKVVSVGMEDVRDVVQVTENDDNSVTVIEKITPKVESDLEGQQLSDLAGYQLYFNEAGTLDKPKHTFDFDGNIQPHPFIINAYGEIEIYFDKGEYNVELRDSNGVIVCSLTNMKNSVAIIGKYQTVESLISEFKKHNTYTPKKRGRPKRKDG